VTLMTGMTLRTETGRQSARGGAAAGERRAGRGVSGVGGRNSMRLCGISLSICRLTLTCVSGSHLLSKEEHPTTITAFANRRSRSPARTDVLSATLGICITGYDERCRPDKAQRVGNPGRCALQGLAPSGRVPARLCRRAQARGQRAGDGGARRRARRAVEGVGVRGALDGR